MPFKKGQTGNPNGRPKADKLLTDALRISAKEKDKSGRIKIRVIADRLILEAMNGNIQAAQIIGDRLEGKPSQPVDHEVDGKIELTWLGED